MLESKFVDIITEGGAPMAAATVAVLDEAQWKQLWAIIARLSHSKPATTELAVKPPSTPSDKEVEKLLRTLRPCGSYAAALRHMRTYCLESGAGAVLDVIPVMDRVGRALLTKYLPWPHPNHRRTCTCQDCKRRRGQDKAIGDFARRLAAVHQGFGFETAVWSASRGAQDIATDCQPMMAVMCDLVKIYCEHLKLPEKRAQKMLEF